MKLVQHTWPNLRNQIVLCLLTSLSVKGLAIIADTYSNHNGPHNHQHPYISAMVNNGTLTYDHDRLVTKVICDLLPFPYSGTGLTRCWAAARWSSETCNMRPGLPSGFIRCSVYNPRMVGSNTSQINFEIQMLSRYENDRLTVSHDLANKRAWAPCVSIGF